MEMELREEMDAAKSSGDLAAMEKWRRGPKGGGRGEYQKKGGELFSRFVAMEIPVSVGRAQADKGGTDGWGGTSSGCRNARLACAEGSPPHNAGHAHSLPAPRSGHSYGRHNCDSEMCRAFEMAGAAVERVCVSAHPEPQHRVVRPNRISGRIH